MKRIVRHEFLELDHLARGLNDLRRGQHERADVKKAWEWVEHVVIGVVQETMRRKRSVLRDWLSGADNPSLENSQKNFHWLSKQIPVQMTINLKRRPSGAVVAVPSLIAHKPGTEYQTAMLHILWKQFFGHGGYERLKPCKKCGEWFVDEGKNRKAVFCSPACSTQWWDRAHRRTAGHSQYRQKRR